MVRSLEQCSILALVGFGCLCWATRIHLEEMQDISNWRCKDLLPYGCGVVCKVIADFEHKSWRFSSFQVRITFLFHPFAFAVFWVQILPGLSLHPFFPLINRWEAGHLTIPHQSMSSGRLPLRKHAKQLWNITIPSRPIINVDTYESVRHTHTPEIYWMLWREYQPSTSTQHIRDDPHGMEIGKNNQL